ncbi:MAG: AbrB/MazE/SpoVT family DNA-binding domain-containing protein [Geminicoccaceae bacterium]
MAKLKVHYDGWICLPATVRRRLGISAGDELDFEYVEGGIKVSSKISAATAKPKGRSKSSASPSTTRRSTGRAKAMDPDEKS